MLKVKQPQLEWVAILDADAAGENLNYAVVPLPSPTKKSQRVIAEGVDLVENYASVQFH